MSERLSIFFTIILISIGYTLYTKITVTYTKQTYLKILEDIQDNQVLIKKVTKFLLKKIHILSIAKFHTLSCIFLYIINNVLLNMVAIDIVIKYSLCILIITATLDLLFIKKLSLIWYNKTLKNHNNLKNTLNKN